MQDEEELLVGFRFYPTDIELIAHYLQRRIEGLARFPNCLIQEYDVYKHEPWNLPCDSFRHRNVDHEMYFFTPRQPATGCPQRASRIAGNGYWKGYGKDRLIKIGSKVIGHRTALTYKSFNGKKEEKTGWIMHEYRLQSPSSGVKIFDDLVLCRIHEKKCSKEKGDGDIVEESLAKWIKAEDTEQQCLMADNGGKKGSSGISAASSQLESSSLSHKPQKLHAHSFRTSDFLSAIVRRIPHLGGIDESGDDRHSQKRKAVDDGNDIDGNSNRSKTGMVACHSPSCSGSGSGSGRSTGGQLRGRRHGSGRCTREKDSVGCGSFEGTPGTPTLDRNDNEHDLRSSRDCLDVKEQERTIVANRFEGTPGTPTLDRNDNEHDLRSSHDGLDAQEQERTIVANSSNIDGASPDSNPSGIFRNFDLNLASDENGDTSTSTSTVA